MNNYIRSMLLICLLATSFSFAQHRSEKDDKIKSLKIAFITEKLDLSSNEAQTFWPIYNQYETDKSALRKKEKNEIHSKIKTSEQLSEKEANELLKQYLIFEEDEEELDKNFIEKISNIISAKKTLILLRSEHEFNRQLIKQYRQKKDGGGRR